ncbi:MAG: SGNH/GDSL hydrolase family protein [Nitrospinae bacterium]|nr:SGNH/GDSL hydrolase family protein [Nitrospinota bacterium]
MTIRNRRLLPGLALSLSSAFWFGFLLCGAVGIFYPADSGMANEGFWYDRAGVAPRDGRRVIPAQLPGPMDGSWAGPGPKWIELPPPSSRQRVLELWVADRHESAPPTLEIVSAGRRVARIVLTPGNGLRWERWEREGKRERLTVDLSAVAGLGAPVRIVNTGGSWVAFSGIGLRAEATPTPLLLFLPFLCIIGMTVALARRDDGEGAPLDLREAAVAGVLTVTAFALTLGGGELAARWMFRDQGTATSEGPGGKGFEYAMADGRHRFPPVGAKGAKPRLLIQGDSVTYGVGVRDWRAVWPARLAARLGPDRFEAAVIAFPNRELDFHRRRLYAEEGGLAPDMVLLQMYVNDVELEGCHHTTCGRPEPTGRWWRALWFHPWLRKNSYLYYFVDHRLAGVWPNGNRSYPEYLNEDFVAGSRKGDLWRLELYRYLMRAVRGGRPVGLLLYPMVPFEGENPVKGLVEAIGHFATGRTLPIHAAVADGTTGATIFDGEGERPPLVRTARDGIDLPGVLFQSPPIPLVGGVQEVRFKVRGGAPVTLRAIDGSGQEYGRREIVADRRKEWEWFSLPLKLPVGGVEEMRLVVYYLGAGEAAVAEVEAPMNLPFTFLDLAPRLNGLKTHTSPFDWHPNEATHALIAEEVAAMVERMLAVKEEE